jgi:hypothetical protein
MLQRYQEWGILNKWWLHIDCIRCKIAQPDVLCLFCLKNSELNFDLLSRICVLYSLGQVLRNQSAHVIFDIQIEKPAIEVPLRVFLFYLHKWKLKLLIPVFIVRKSLIQEPFQALLRDFALYQVEGRCRSAKDYFFFRVWNVFIFYNLIQGYQRLLIFALIEQDYDKALWLAKLSCIRYPLVDEANLILKLWAKNVC